MWELVGTFLSLRSSLSLPGNLSIKGAHFLAAATICFDELRIHKGCGLIGSTVDLQAMLLYIIKYNTPGPRPCEVGTSSPRMMSDYTQENKTAAECLLEVGGAAGHAKSALEMGLWIYGDY